MTTRGKLPWIFALAGVGLLAVFYLVRQALLPFFVATVLAYLLAPLVTWLSRRIRRGVAVTLVLLTSLGGFALVSTVLVPLAWTQVDRLVRTLPEWSRQLQTRLAPWLEQHPEAKLGLTSVFESVKPEDLLAGLRTAGAGVLSLFLNLLALLLVPVILYYLLLEGPRFLHTAEGYIPPRYRFRVRAFIEAVHERLGGYIRGQLAVASVMSLLQGIAFAILGVPYAWLLGLVAGFSNFVPYSPYALALVPAGVIAFVTGASLAKVVTLAIVFTLVQKAETLYFTPVWVGRATRLHPLEVLLALLSFGFLFGLLGLIFAVPLMIVFKVAFEQFLVDYRAHPWFRGEQA